MPAGLTRDLPRLATLWFLHPSLHLALLHPLRLFLAWVCVSIFCSAFLPGQEKGASPRAPSSATVDECGYVSQKFLGSFALSHQAPHPRRGVAG